MSDDLEDLLRRAMKTLDDQVPPGYFDDFSRQTLARLEDPMLHAEPIAALGAGASEAGEPIAASSADALPAMAADEASPLEAAPVPPKKQRDEDSGLHDIRNLASSQRMRLSSKRASQNPISGHEDPLASASGSWRAVALPEPAKMVSLPELAEVSPAREAAKPEKAEKADKTAKAEKAAVAEKAAAEKAADKAAAKTAEKAAAKTARAEKAAPVEKETAKTARAEKAAAAKVARPPEGAAAPAVEPSSVTPITAAKPKPAAAKRGGARSALIAGAGLAVAAAAGAVIVMSTGKDKADERAAPLAAERREGVQMPQLRQVAPPPAPAADVAGSAAMAVPEIKPTVPDERAKAPPPVEKPTKSIGKYVPEVVDEPKAPDKGKKDEPKKKPEPGDPDFDSLLKEAGYQAKKADAPKLEKKSLSGDDIKKSMNAVAGKVASCYSGQQGTAAVKLTVAPTGQIQKVAVTGTFAGTPVGACVEGAVQGVAFPPWDGAPQSVSFSYLLAE